MAFAVTAILPNWNGARLLPHALGSLRAQTLPPAATVVVDNGSSDESVAIAENWGAEVIRLPANEGFAAAANAGIRAVATPWVVLLNNDVTLAPDWLERIVNAAEARGAWFASGKLLTAGGERTLDGGFDAICRGGSGWRCGAGRPDSPLWDEERPIAFAPFTAVLVRKDLFAKLGLLDERFESYLEDVDFCLRCAAAGYGGIYVPSAMAHHRGSATLGRWNPATVRRIARNQVFLIAKHYPAGWWRRYGWPVLVAQLLWGLVAFRHGAGAAFLQGKWEAILRFRELRGRSTPALPALLANSERDIFELQRRSGFDLYWKVYFALT